jgi:hypothetical protein
MAIDAAIWRDERQQRQQLTQAWYTAALQRTKRLPTLKQLLSTGPARPLKGKELEKRRSEHREMMANVDIGKLTKRIRKPS